MCCRNAWLLDAHPAPHPLAVHRPRHTGPQEKMANKLDSPISYPQTEHEVVKGYDEKYNMAEEDQFETKDKEQEEERQKMDSERGRTDC